MNHTPTLIERAAARVDLARMNLTDAEIALHICKLEMRAALAAQRQAVNMISAAIIDNEGHRSGRYLDTFAAL